MGVLGGLSPKLKYETLESVEFLSTIILFCNLATVLAVIT